MKGWTAAQDLKDGASQGPDVRAMVAALIFDDLFRHELRSSHVVLKDFMSRGIPCTWQDGEKTKTPNFLAIKCSRIQASSMWGLQRTLVCLYHIYIICVCIYYIYMYIWNACPDWIKTIKHVSAVNWPLMWGFSRSFAVPKSINFTTPSSVSITFSAFKSLWTIPGCAHGYPMVSLRKILQETHGFLTIKMRRSCKVSFHPMGMHGPLDVSMVVSRSSPPAEHRCLLGDWK